MGGPHIWWGKNEDPGHGWPFIEVINLFPCSTQLNMKFIMLINVKMPTIVGILAFISMKNTTSGVKRQEKYSRFSIYEHDKVSCSVELSMKKRFFIPRGLYIFTQVLLTQLYMRFFLLRLSWWWGEILSHRQSFLRNMLEAHWFY